MESVVYKIVGYFQQTHLVYKNLLIENHPGFFGLTQLNRPDFR